MKACRRYINLSSRYIVNNVESVYFVVAVIIYAGILFISIASDFYRGSGEGLHYYLHFAFVNKYKGFLATVSSVPAILNFSKEWRHEFFVYTFSRSGKRIYPFAICNAAAITAFLVALLGTLAFSLAVLVREPLYPGNEILLSSCINNYANGALMAEGRYVLYYFLTMVLQCSMSAFYAAASTFIATIVVDPYLTIVFPMVLCIFATAILARLKVPMAVNPYYVFNGSNILLYIFADGTEYNFSLLSCLYPHIYAFAGILLFGILSCVSLSKKIERATIK